MVVLSAAVMQADERVLKSELDYVKQFFRTNFGQAQAEQLTLALREALKNPVDVRGVCMQIRANMPHAKRLLLLQYLYGIARADGNVDPREVDLIRRMAAALGISDKDRASIEAPFHRRKARPLHRAGNRTRRQRCRHQKGLPPTGIEIPPRQGSGHGRSLREAGRVTLPRSAGSLREPKKDSRVQVMPGLG